VVEQVAELLVTSPSVTTVALLRLLQAETKKMAKLREKRNLRKVDIGQKACKSLACAFYGCQNPARVPKFLTAAGRKKGSGENVRLLDGQLLYTSSWIGFRQSRA
jgi:hypothetical protein